MSKNIHVMCDFFMQIIKILFVDTYIIHIILHIYILHGIIYIICDTFIKSKIRLKINFLTHIVVHFCAIKLTYSYKFSQLKNISNAISH